jgi:hypothetical protein
MDNISFDGQRVEDEQECENISDASVILKFDILPDDVGIMLDEHIKSEDILQDSDRYINVRKFDKEFIKVFQAEVDRTKGEKNCESLNESTFNEDEETLIKQKIDSFVPTVVKMREGEHRNHVLKLIGNKRKLIKEKLTKMVSFFIEQKLNLMRYLRPMNSEILTEVIK